MSTLSYKWKAKTCQDGCGDYGSCDGHEYEITFQSTSGYLAFYDNGRNVFILSVDEANVLYEVLNRLSAARVEIRPDLKVNLI